MKKKKKKNLQISQGGLKRRQNMEKRRNKLNNQMSLYQTVMLLSVKLSSKTIVLPATLLQVMIKIQQDQDSEVLLVDKLEALISQPVKL